MAEGHKVSGKQRIPGAIFSYFSQLTFTVALKQLKTRCPDISAQLKYMSREIFAVLFIARTRTHTHARARVRDGMRSAFSP